MNYKLKQSDIIFVKTCIHVLLLYFLVNPFYLAIIDELGGDPVKAITHYTGMGALNLLLITLQSLRLQHGLELKKSISFDDYWDCMLLHMLSVMCFVFSFSKYNLIFYFLLKKSFKTVHFCWDGRFPDYFVSGSFFYKLCQDKNGKFVAKAS